MNILITGSAGFIGFHLAQALLKNGKAVIGVDNLNDYYDPGLKQGRLDILAKYDKFNFFRLDISDRKGVSALFKDHTINVVVNLAAQAGVRYSIENPDAYVDSNLIGFVNILEGCRHSKVEHLVYASSSSVYGANKKMPFSVDDPVDHPVSLYAATKKSNELMAHAYAHLYGMPVTGLRFFTVYGPWGRPDMAYFKFTKAIMKGQAIDVYNHGNMRRDFTYIDDIVKGVIRVMENPPGQDKGQPQDGVHAEFRQISESLELSELSGSLAPYRLYNIGNNEPVELGIFIETLEKHLGETAVKNMLPMQLGDVPATYADIDTLTRDTGFKPETTIDEGLKRFVTWYKEYYSTIDTA